MNKEVSSVDISNDNEDKIDLEELLALARNLPIEPVAANKKMTQQEIKAMLKNRNAGK
ncbi:MAG: hypothetical protein OEW63_04070 [Gammaproteobacteria bacterium]|nr:hypothetical protein [Gammaproteobacteria bacterium]